MKDFMVQEEEIRGQRWTCVKDMTREKDFNCAIYLEYGPHIREGKLQLWKELLELREKIGVPMLIIGDFKEILILEERIGVFVYLITVVTLDNG